MNIRNEWMTNYESFGEGYLKQKQLQDVVCRFDIQRNESNEGFSVIIDGITEQAVVQQHINEISKNKIHLKLHCQTDSVVKTGSTVQHANSTYVVIDEVMTNGAYKSTKMQKSYDTIKFYDTNHNLYIFPYVVYNGNMDIDNNKYITLASDEFTIHCPNDTDTSHINLNTRFILMGDAYKVIGIDKLSKVGLLEIKVKADQITVNDNLSLSIADYYSNQIQKSITIKNSNTATMLYTNSTLQLIVECMDNGIVVNNPIVTYGSSNVNIATVNNSGLITAIGTGLVNISANYGGVISMISINSVMSISDDYNVVVSPVDNTIIFGKSKTFTASIMNNGILSNISNCTWSLINSDGTTTPYATITTNNLICTITIPSKSTLVGKYIKLRASLLSDNSTYTEREIKIIGLL